MAHPGENPSRDVIDNNDKAKKAPAVAPATAPVESSEAESSLPEMISKAKSALSKLMEENPKLASSAFITGVVKVLDFAEKNSAMFPGVYFDTIVKNGPVLKPEESDAVKKNILSGKNQDPTDVLNQLAQDATAARKSTEGASYALFGKRLAENPDELFSKLTKLKIDEKTAAYTKGTVTEWFISKKSFIKPGSLLLLCANPIKSSKLLQLKSEPFVAMVNEQGKLGTYQSGKWQELDQKTIGIGSALMPIAMISPNPKKAIGQKTSA